MIRIKGVSFKDARTGIGIRFVDRCDQVWLCDGQQIIISFQILGKILESITTIVAFTKTRALDHGSHTAI